ncbi:MAG TPA: G/U mismatch-specific DNA glycosylase [Vicinamibacterales bacterium]|nr:G/U mismatch-specific DNA glycosylase [Vicinamibacterales bacterium]
MKKAELDAAYGRTIRDVLAFGLDVIFVGINPGRYSGATGFHFAGPGNRFWPALHASGFTDRRLQPAEVGLLPEFGCGITNLVARTTARADELTADELRAGRRSLERKVRRYRPQWVAFVGLGAYRVALGKPAATVGPQRDTIAGARVWVLPSTSGLNANHRPEDFAKQFRELRQAVRVSR